MRNPCSLSALSVQLRLMLLDDAVVAPRLPGAAGVDGGGAGVLALAVLE